MALRLKVIDGADQGQSFLLPQEGTLLVGSSKKHVDICLHDLYVARVHWEVEVKGQHVLVTAHDTPGGTLVNGAKVSKYELQLGDVVRSGNSHLRLELCTDAAPGIPARVLNPEEPPKPAALPHLPAAELDKLVGHTLAHFKVRAVLGKRHWGTVFRALDTKKSQEVALRVFADFPANDQEMQNFGKALKGGLTIRHPHLVSLLGAGKTGPYGWIAMELIEGESLIPIIERLSTKGKIKWSRALRVGVHMARALEFTHQHHLIHGHVTPGNILVQSADNTAKLNDLMLFKVVDGSALAQRQSEEKWKADLPFLAPELTYPDTFVDDLTDQYNLGAVLYALLTGKVPFEGSTPEKMLNKIRQAVPVKPTELQPSVPIELQAVVLKMLAKHQEDRYPSPADVRADLERIAAARAIEV